MAAKSITRYQSPIGMVIYPNLQKARAFKANEAKKYDTLFVPKPEFTQEFASLVKGLADHSGPATSYPFKPHTSKNRETGEIETVDGQLAFTFKVAEKTQTKRGEWDRRPVFFDREGKVLSPDEEPELRSGDLVRIEFTAYQWGPGPMGSGVTLQPVGVQVIRSSADGPVAAAPPEFAPVSDEDATF